MFKKTPIYKTKKNIQDAHEAIRPADLNITPDMVKDSLKDEQYKLYNLIWTRFMASQMASTVLNSYGAEIENGDYILRASGSTVKFDGFIMVEWFIVK